MSAWPESFAEAAALTAYTAELQEKRRNARNQRDVQVAALYPHVRTFVLKQVDAIGVGESAAEAVRRVPRTMTLVTPDLAKPARDHWFVGPYPVLSRDLRWNAGSEELDFVTSDGTKALRGHFRLAHSRLRAYGMLDIGGESVAVEYQVPPQSYNMKVAKGAAYWSNSAQKIEWNTDSREWKAAKWSERKNELEFTFGVNGEEVIGDEEVFTFVAWFKDLRNEQPWTPVPLTYSGTLDPRTNILAFALNTGVEPSPGEEPVLFPYSLQVKLVDFGRNFDGGFVAEKPPSINGSVVYGCVGTWANAHTGGLYRLQGDGPARAVSVHGGTLYAGVTPAAHTAIDGNRLTWSGLPETAAAEAGLPTAGFIDFSADGSRIVGGSSGATGTRVHADEVAAATADGELAALFRHARKAADFADPGLKELINMTQFEYDTVGKVFDAVQQGSMDDFYKILQNYMDADLQKTFFGPVPPLDAELKAISETKGTKGTEPQPWYKSLSVPYTATALGKFSDDEAAKKLNAARAEAWLSSTTAASDVMEAQGPLLYQREYLKRNSLLAWYLADQKNNAAAYAPIIEQKAKEWIALAKDQNVGTTEQLAELEKQINKLADSAKQNKQYWAFALYTYTLTPAYLNLMQLVMMSNGGDGSAFTIEVQRTVALLSALDTTSLFAKEYANTLQMFHFARLLPQLVDLGVELPEFNFVVKQIIDEFIKTYLNSPDPKMREAALELQKHASSELIGKMLSIMHTAAAVGYGLMNWGFVSARYQSLCAKILAGTPAVVVRLGALAMIGTVMMFFASGTADFNSLTPAQKTFVVIGGVNVLAINALPIVKWGVALGEVFTQNRAFLSSAKVVFSSQVLTKAQETAVNGFRGWLLQEAGPKIPFVTKNPRQWWAAYQAGAVAGPHLPQKGLVRAVFGKNLSRFLATRVAGAFAIVGIVLSAIDLAKSGEPMEKAINALFLIAAALELVAVLGAWAFLGSTLAVGGMLVSTAFAIVGVVGFVALLAGAILLIILMTRPQQSPVERFATGQAKNAGLYMPDKVAIESFEFYRPLGQPQRAGISLFPSSFPPGANAYLTIGSDGTVKQGPFDGSGHTAFYFEVDYLGRVKIGAPILDSQGKIVLQTLGTDDAGKIISKNFDGDNVPIDPRLMWRAESQGPGSYEKSEGGTEQLKSAPFKIRSVYWDEKETPKYLATDGTTGWRLTEDANQAALITLTMQATKPAQLRMNDVTWLTIARDEVTGPALQVPGSEPRTWSISPALPQDIELNTEDGTIKMRTGVQVPPAPSRTYQLTVSNEVGSVSTSFKLEVRKPEEALVFA